jgi:DNA polymerase-3 subunit gamma/tau
VSVVSEGGAPTIREARAAQAGELEAEALAHPLVQAALRAFPDARLKVQSREEKAAAAEVEALPEVPDDWDPFEE